MIARLISVIEVSQGGVRRYFTTEGEPIGAGPEGVPTDETPISAEEVIATVPKRRYVPPFDPGGPGLRMGASDENEEA